MLKWLIRSRLAAYEKKFNYDMNYARDILAADTKAFFAFAKVMKLGAYRRDVPKDVYWAAKLVGVLSEDCGPCTQLVVTLALADGIDPKLMASLVAGDEAALAEPVKLGVAFAKAAIAHDVAADDLRDDITKRWGPRALVAIAFAITEARIYPMLKYALGHGKTCQRVVVAGTTVAVVRAA